MTRQEAKKIMENEVRCVRNPNCERLECRNCYLVMPEHTVLKAYDVAIKALEQEPCEDAISRQAVNILVDELARVISDERCCMSRGRSTATIMQDILDLPSVNSQEPKTGHWIAQDIYNCHTDFMCSKCGYIHSFMHLYGQPTADYTYCPNCGAKMEEQA